MALEFSFVFNKWFYKRKTFEIFILRKMSLKKIQRLIQTSDNDKVLKVYGCVICTWSCVRQCTKQEIKEKVPARSEIKRGKKPPVN